MSDFDVLIRGGMVFDGRRNPRYRGDVGIKDGKIAAVGRLRTSDARKTLDASGMHVAPGVVDLHTHYDSQVFWDPSCSISSWHGVTSVVIGNCGFGFAPVKPEFRDRSMLTMTRVEAIPLASMQEGMPWDWVTFPEFLDSVDRTPKAVNILAYQPLNPILTWVMGLERAKAGEMPTDAEHAEMRRLLNHALDAGAGGWSAQWHPPSPDMPTGAGQLDYDGTYMPTDVMNFETIMELASVLAERNQGSMQFFGKGKLVEEVAELGRPIVLTNLVSGPEQRETIAWLNGCWERGLPIHVNAFTTQVGSTFRVIDNYGAGTWDFVTAWREATLGTLEEKLAKLSDPTCRAAMKAQLPDIPRIPEIVVLRGQTPETAQWDETKIKDIARALGKDLVDTFWDIAVADRLETVFFADNVNLDAKYLKELLQCEWVGPGISDGGAHSKYLTAGRYPTEFLVNHVRDSAWMSVEDAHWKLSALPAFASGFRGRGTIEEGAAADLIVYDYENLAILPEEVAYDYPADEWRRVQRASGYRYILVNGEITIEEDKQQTDVTSGRLLRHGVDH
jgi:N-acyl-D-amino-acid deacylase